jgi:hypothetical protein
MVYLILHKVRGEPAFDIAEQIQIGDEEGWIIPTSGHRAYPYETWPLEAWGQPFIGNVPTIPDDWPDHYPMDVGSPPKPDLNIMALISNLLPKVKDRRF